MHEWEPTGSKKISLQTINMFFQKAFYNQNSQVHALLQIYK